LKLRVNHILLLAVAPRLGAWLAAWTGAARAAGAALLAVQVLRHRVSRRLQVVHGLADGVDIVAAGGLFEGVDGGLDGGLVGIGDRVAGFLEGLLHGPDEVVGFVAGVGEVALALVLVGVGLGVAGHAVHFVLAQAAGGLDSDLGFLACRLVLGGDVED